MSTTVYRQFLYLGPLAIPDRWGPGAGHKFKVITRKNPNGDIPICVGILGDGPCNGPKTSTLYLLQHVTVILFAAPKAGGLLNEV